MMDKNPYKPYAINNNQSLNNENKKILTMFLLKILKDTKFIKMKTLFSHHDDYLEFVDKMQELGIESIKEDQSLCSDYSSIEINFQTSIGELLGLLTEEELDEFYEKKLNKFLNKKVQDCYRSVSK